MMLSIINMIMMCIFPAAVFMILSIGIPGGMILITVHPGGDFITGGIPITGIIITAGMILITGRPSHFSAVMDIMAVIIIPVIIIRTVIRPMSRVRRRSNVILPEEVSCRSARAPYAGSIKARKSQCGTQR